MLGSPVTAVKVELENRHEHGMGGVPHQAGE